MVGLVVNACVGSLRSSFSDFHSNSVSDVVLLLRGFACCGALLSGGCGLLGSSDDLLVVGLVISSGEDLDVVTRVLIVVLGAFVAL
jgi:hypothetical protein